MAAKQKPAKLTTPSGGISGFFQRLWNFLVISWIGLGMNLKEIFTFHRKFDLQKIPRRPGEVAVVTGGGRGIGIEIVKKLLILDMHVVIGCRIKSTATEAIEKIRKGGVATGTTNVLSLDLTSLESVRDFGNKVVLKYPKIHVLINNGGIMLTPYSLTMDGNESQFQVNYLSHFLLTNILLPKLIRGGRAGKTSRIVNVSSAAHRGGRINFEDINQTQMYCKTMAYMASKLMQVVSTKDLNGRLVKEGVHLRVYSVHPGVVKTDLYEHMWLVRTFGFLFRLLYKTPEQGADGVVFAAISSKFEGEGGHYFANCKRDWVNPSAKRDEVQKRLWTLSCQMTDWNDVSFADVVKRAMINARNAKDVKDVKGPVTGHVAKLERQERIEDGAQIYPRIELISAKSSVSSVSTIPGTEAVSVVIIPATEASSSDSDDDGVSLGRGDTTVEQKHVTSLPDKAVDHEDKVVITEITEDAKS